MVPYPTIPFYSSIEEPNYLYININSICVSDECPTDVCCIALMEARKWMHEKKLRSDSISMSPSSVTSCNYSCGSSPYVSNHPLEISHYAQ